jgi:predicted Zn-ribbon and HTH transcriptional regulator
MGMSEPTPQQNLFFVDFLIEALTAMSMGDARGLAVDRAEVADALGGVQDYIDNVARNIYEAAVMRGVAANALLTFRARWGRLYREFPNPALALQHFRDFFKDQDLIDVMHVTEPLKVKLQSELATASVGPAPTTGGHSWPRVTDASRAVRIDKAAISRAVRSGEVKSISLDGVRRVEPDSLIAFARAYRRQRQKTQVERKQARAEDRVPSILPKWKCKACGAEYPDRKVPSRCNNCGTGPIQPVQRRPREGR